MKIISYLTSTFYLLLLCNLITLRLLNKLSLLINLLSPIIKHDKVIGSVWTAIILISHSEKNVIDVKHKLENKTKICKTHILCIFIINNKLPIYTIIKINNYIINPNMIIIMFQITNKIREKQAMKLLNTHWLSQEIIKIIKFYKSLLPVLLKSY